MKVCITKTSDSEYREIIEIDNIVSFIKTHGKIVVSLPDPLFGDPVDVDFCIEIYDDWRE